jgi:histidinol-phosphate aminotransferase
VGRIVTERERLLSILGQFDWLKPYPSHANFILCQVSKFSAAAVKQRLAEQGILVRYYSSPRLADHIRISVGTAEQMTRLEQGLRTIQ